MILVFLVGCNFSVNFDSGKKSTKKEDIKLQITKVDKEAGFSAENSELYEQLEELLQENPDLGVQGDFTIHVVSDIEFEGEKRLLMLGVNRVKEDLKNIEFNLTLGSKSADLYIYDDTHVTLDHNELGTIKSGHAIPFTLPITEEEIQFYMTISDDDKIFDINNFKYD